MSKMEDFISGSLEFACNLREIWASGDYQLQELQNALLKPELDMIAKKMNVEVQKTTNL